MLREVKTLLFPVTGYYRKAVTRILYRPKWTRVTDMVRGTVPKVRISYLHDICQHCDEAPCIEACLVKAIYKRDDGIVIIDPEKCRGHRLCIPSCPFGVIYFNDDLNIAQKCTFCAHLLDRDWKEPRCVDVCPTGAFTFGEEAEMKELIGNADGRGDW